MRREAASGLVLVFLSATLPVQAQPMGADSLTKHGLALRRQQRDAEALADFLRAYAIVPAPRTLAQIALAEQALGLWVAAEAHLGRALLETDDRWIEEHRQLLVEGLADIRTHLGALEVDADVRGAELWVNGTRTPALPLAEPLRVEAGNVTIEVRALGYATASRQTSVEAGETAHETIHLVPLVPPTIPEVIPAQHAQMKPPGNAPHSAQPARVVRSDRPSAASFVFFGAAAVGVAVGAYLGVRTLTTKGERDGHCQADTCDPQGVALDTKARLFADRSTAWFAFGIAAAGLGVGLSWVSRWGAAPVKLSTLRLNVDVGIREGHAMLGGAW